MYVHGQLLTVFARLTVTHNPGLFQEGYESHQELVQYMKDFAHNAASLWSWPPPVEEKPLPKPTTKDAGQVVDARNGVYPVCVVSGVQSWNTSDGTAHQSVRFDNGGVKQTN